MKKLFFLPVLLAFFSLPCLAVMHIGISGGYSYASFNELNSYWNTIKQDAEAFSNTITANWKDYGSGVYANFDLNFNLDKNFWWV